YALSSTVHVALFERDPGASGSSYSVTVDGTGTPVAQVVCVGYNGTDGEATVVDPAKITGGSSDTNPTSYTLPALTVSVAGSINVVFASTYSFPVDLPSGFNLIVQHSFEIVVAERAVSVGSTGTITLERDGGTQYAGPGAGLHFIVEPSSGGEPEPPDPLEVDPLSALRMGTNIVGLKSFAQVTAAFAFSKVGMSPNSLDSNLLGNPAFEVGTMALQGGKSGAPSLTSFATELESRLPARPALRTWMESLGSVNLAIGSLGAGLSAP